MQDLVLIFSKCEKKRREVYEFHFKGFYNGKKIRVLNVKATAGTFIEVNCSYLIWAKKVDVIDSVLWVKLIKYKKIS
jgi:hypothetical protein